MSYGTGRAVDKRFKSYGERPSVAFMIVPPRFGNHSGVLGNDAWVAMYKFQCTLIAVLKASVTKSISFLNQRNYALLETAENTTFVNRQDCFALILIGKLIILINIDRRFRVDVVRHNAGGRLVAAPLLGRGQCAGDPGGAGPRAPRLGTGQAGRRAAGPRGNIT